MGNPIEGIDTEPTGPSRADRADAATRMMEEAWAADAAARAARPPPPSAPVGLSTASGFEAARATPMALPTAPPPAAQLPATGPTVTARELAATATAAPTSEATAAVRTATTALETAQRARQGADQELGRQLGRFGAGLSTAQLQAYTSAYRQQNAAAYQGEAAAATRLSSVLRDQGPALERAAATPDGARVLARGLGALAQSSEAPAAVELASQVLGRDGPAAANLRAQPNFERDVFERGLPNAAAILAARNPNSPAELGRELSRLVAPLGTAGSQAFQTYTQVSNMAAGNLDGVRNIVDRWGTASPLMRGFAGAGVVGSLTAAGLSTARGAALGQQLEAYARAGQGGAELLSGVLGSMTTGARYAAQGARAATALARLAPGLGVVANAASLAFNSSQFANTRNAGYAVAATGDAIATLGSAIGAFPPAAVPGAIVSAFGTAISAGGDFVANRIADARSREQQTQALTAAGLSPEAARTYVAEGQGVRALIAAGQTPQQVQALAGTPNGASVLARTEELGMLSRAFSAMGVPADRVGPTLSAFTGPELSALTMGLQRAGGGQNARVDDMRAFLSAVAQRSGYSQDARQALGALVRQ